jgi:hypothetical protein
VSRHPRNQPPPEGHVLVTASAIGGLSVALAAGLAATGVGERMDGMIAATVSRAGRETFPNHLPEPVLWLATAVLAFGLAFAILSTAGTGRRLTLWITAVMLVGAWAPVLSLAAHLPAVSVPWIATFWSGVCALFYTSNHHMACDDGPAKQP